MSCPICKSEKVGEQASHCPECNSDLTSFALINEVSNQTSSLKKASMSLGLVALLTMAGWAFTYTQGSAGAAVTVDETAMPDNTAVAELADLKKALATKDDEIASLSGKIEALHATIESSASDIVEVGVHGKHKLHIVKEGESLWSISELYHGHGFKHHHIGGHNTVDNPDHIEVGDTLVILN